MDTEHEPATPSDGQEKLDPWDRMNRAAQELAESVQALPNSTPALRIEPFQLPPIPRLSLTYEVDPKPVPADARHLTVSVRTVPVYGSSETHTFHSDSGLTWQTYGAEHDYSEDRMLEVLNSDGEVVASYPAGTWLDACYPAYRNPDAAATS